MNLSDSDDVHDEDSKLNYPDKTTRPKHRAIMLAISLAALVLSATPSHALTLSELPPKFNIPWGNSAGVPYINSIPQTSQIGIANCRASLTDGFPPLTFTPPGAGGCPPFGADFNGIFKQITQWSQWQAAGGQVFFDSAFATGAGGYPSTAIINSLVMPGDQWMSLVDSNTGNPDSGAANWVQVPSHVPIGTPVPSLSSTVPFGYVAANGLTIGSAASNATGLANSITKFLFEFIWANCPNTQCQVFTSSGSPTSRGANAAADYAANVAIAVYNLKGQGLIGADTMGGATSSFLAGVPVTSGNTTTPGSVLGENLHPLIIAELAVHSHPNSLHDPGHAHQIQIVQTAAFGAGGQNAYVPGSVSNTQVATTGITITNASVGSGTGHNTVELSTVVYWILKL